MMRRDLLALIGIVALGWERPIWAQQKAMPVIAQKGCQSMSLDEAGPRVG
jgi:hypothetical protein